MRGARERRWCGVQKLGWGATAEAFQPHDLRTGCRGLTSRVPRSLCEIQLLMYPCSILTGQEGREQRSPSGALHGQRCETLGSLEYLRVAWRGLRVFANPGRIGNGMIRRLLGGVGPCVRDWKRVLSWAGLPKKVKPPTETRSEVHPVQVAHA